MEKEYECYEEEVQPSRKMDYKPIMYIYIYIYIYIYNVGRVDTLSYNSFRWRSIHLFNSLPMHLRSISSCSVLRFMTQLDIFPGSVEDLPCLPGFKTAWMVEIVDGGHPVMAWLPIRCN